MEILFDPIRLTPLPDISTDRKKSNVHTLLRKETEQNSTPALKALTAWRLNDFFTDSGKVGEEIRERARVPLTPSRSPPCLCSDPVVHLGFVKICIICNNITYLNGFFTRWEKQKQIVRFGIPVVIH